MIHKFSRCTLNAALILMLSGCSLLPNERVPEYNVPSATRNGTIVTEGGSDFAADPWWKGLDDPQLDRIVDNVLTSNKDLDIALANIAKARSQLKAAQYAWLPTLGIQAGGVGAGGIETSYQPRGGLSQSSALQNGLGNFSVAYAGFTPEYSLNIFETINQTKVAQASLDMQQSAYYAARVTLIGQATAGYLNLIIARRNLALQEHLIELFKRNKAATFVRYSSGSADGVAVAQLEGRLRQANTKRNQYIEEISALENALSVLMGKHVAPLETVRNPMDVDPNLLIPKELPSSALRSRPDMQMAEANLRKTGAQVSLANAAFFPTISITSLLGGASMMLSNLFSSSGGVWMASGSITGNVFNPQKYAAIASAKEDEKAAYANYEKAVISAFADVDNQLTGMQFANTNYEEWVEFSRAQHRESQISLARYRSGMADIRTKLEAEIKVAESDLSLNTAKQHQLSQLVSLFQSFGSGYEYQPRK